MPDRLKRVRLPHLAVVMAILAFPLLASGVAQASVGGGMMASSTTQPNLKSATPITGSPTQLEVCYDKTITVGATGPTSFFAVGYRAGNNLRSTNAQVDPTNTSCVIVTFGSAVTSSSQSNKSFYTVLTELAGAVSANTGLSSS